MKKNLNPAETESLERSSNDYDAPDSKAQLDPLQYARIAQNFYDAVMEDDLDKAVQAFRSIQGEIEHLAMFLPDKKNQRVSPLILAIEYNSMTCFEFLLKQHHEKRDDIKKATKSVGLKEVDVFIHHGETMAGKNALHLLAMADRGPEVLEMLKKHQQFLQNVNIINGVDKSGATPLLTAVERKNVRIAKFLIENHANFGDEAMDKFGQSPFKIAVTNGLEDLVKEMLKKDDNKEELLTNSKLFGEGHTVLYPAAFSKNDSLFTFLIQEMGSTTAERSLKQEITHEVDSHTFVKQICISGMSAAMKNLIKVTKPKDVGEDIKLENGDEHDSKLNPLSLMWAVKADQLEIVELLLKSHFRQELLGKKDKQERNVFHYAASSNNTTILTLLMEHTQDCSFLMNEKDVNGCTPAHFAAVAGLCENVWLLLGDNAKMNNESVFHCENCVKQSRLSVETLQSLLKTYDENDKAACLNALKTHNKRKRTPVHEAALGGRKDVLKLLLEKLPSLAFDKSKDRGWTPLHFAVASRSSETVAFLVKKFPEMVNIKSYYDRTAVVLAAESGNAKILRYLLDNGAKVFGDSPQENLLDAVMRCQYLTVREETALEIVKFCYEMEDVDLMKNVMKNTEAGPEGIMATLLNRKMSKVAQEILRGCLRTSIGGIEKEEIRKYHFFPIQDDEEKDKKFLLAIETMLDNKCFECLSDPVVVKFLDMKWQHSTAKRWYLFSVVLYIFFLLSLTTYIMLETRGTFSSRSPGLIILSLVSITVIVLNIIKEIFQIIFSLKDYFWDPNNYIEWTMYVSAAIYLFPLHEDKTTAQIEAGAIAVFIAWINFIWFIKRLSLFGIYIIMAKRVFTSLLKVLPMVILFIFAFSMAFFLLMKKDEGYSNIPLGMLTTAVMMAGEINYRDGFLGENAEPHLLLKQLFLVCFLLLGTIVIMNLLVGLAVGDTDKTMKRCKEEKRFYKATLIVVIERSISNLRRLLPKCFEGILKHIAGIKKVDDPFKENSKEDEEKKKSRLIWLWEKVYLDTSLDDIEETEEILSKVEKLEKENKIILSKLESLCTDVMGRNGSDSK